MKHGRKAQFSTVILLGTLGVLAACSVAQMGTTAVTAYDFFKDPDVSLQAKSYAAADYLIQQTRGHIDRQADVIKVKPLDDIERPGMHAEMNKMIPEQVGLRLMQLGYKIDLTGVAREEEAAGMKAPPGKPGYILSGYYKKHFFEMDVSLRITGVDTGRLLASFDYTMPTTWEMGKQAKPEPEIFRIPPQQ